MEIYIGIPCYQVASSIEGVLKRLAVVRDDLNIILVNDGSPDDLDRVIESVEKKGFRSFTYHKHEANKGYGGAQKTIFGIFKEKAKHKEDLLILVHGDGQTPEEEIERFIFEAKQNPYLDAVLGSRMLNPISVQMKFGRPLFKIVFDILLTIVQNITYNLSLTTYASGYRAFTKKGLEKLNFTDTSNRHIFDTECLILFRFFNLKYKEICVPVVRNDTGASANQLKTYAKNTIELLFKYSFQWRTKSMKFLIINSDDYGMAPSINTGIRDAFRSRAITSTSIMANADHFDNAVYLAKKNGYLNNIGIHVNVSEGKPLGRGYKTITNESGTFLGISQLIMRSKLRMLDETELEQEIRLQFEKCKEAGIPLTHADTHQWSQILPEVSRALIRVATEYNIFCIRSVGERTNLLNVLGAHPRAILNSLVITFLNGRHKKDLHASPLISPDYFQGILLSGHPNHEKALIHMAKKIGPGTTELMCHVGNKSEEALKEFTYYTNERRRELRSLTGPSFKKSLEDAGIKAISYRDFLQL